MIEKQRLLTLLSGIFAFTALSGLSQSAIPAQLGRGFQSQQFDVEGVKRQALIYVPDEAKTAPTPLVFVFHGHGGTARNAVRSFGMNRHWPEAISVYMQGLNTPGRLTDPEGRRPGWQGRAGDQSDRDLKFFDAVLERLMQDIKVDPNRIYATGHSNGGGFTYLLWASRGEVLAAVAPSAAAAGVRQSGDLKPKPAMHLAGKKDQLVKYEWQKFMIDFVRKLNNCEPEGKPWSELCTLYPSKTGTPLVTFIHPGGHQFVQSAPPLIVKFFKENPAPSE